MIPSSFPDKPGEARIELPDSAIKGENAQLTCSTADPGYPAADLIWSMLGEADEVGRGPVLAFTPLQLDDTGVYVCTPENNVGQGLADTAELVVNGECKLFLSTVTLDI